MSQQSVAGRPTIMLTAYSVIRYLLLPWHLLRESRRCGHPAFNTATWRALLGKAAQQFPSHTIWIDVSEDLPEPAARRLIEKLFQHYDTCSFVLTGYSAAARLARDPKLTERCQYAIRPLDITAAVGHFFDAVQPKLVLMAGSDITPNLYRQAQIRNVPLVYLNVTATPRVVPLVNRIAGYGRQLLQGITMVVTQTEAEATRWLVLGVPQKRLKVAGYLKNDVKVMDRGIAEKVNSSKLWSAERVTLLAASIRSEEYPLVFDALRRLTPAMPQLLLVLVPHSDTSPDKVVAMCRQRGFLVARHSRSEVVKPSTQVLLLESEDQLRQLYFQCDVVLAGGTFDANEEDDILTPAASGIPMIVGPDETSHSDICDLLVAAQAVSIVKNAQELAEQLRYLTQHRELAQEMSEAALRVIDNNRGATSRVCHILKEQLEWTRPAID